MTSQEALNYFKRRKAMYLDDRIQEYENKAIEALEKQIPKPPKIYDDKGLEDAAQCQCGSWSIIGHYGTRMKYCSDCGQALDWSECE